MSDEKREEKKEEHPVDAYLRVTGRQETAPMTFADLKAVWDFTDAPPQEAQSEPAATS